ncbi:hypothetical protein [Sedimentibacter sp. MB31-C6]|uniref:hypothetical protein n=1 Tax=Sedimentibacter sp. MB31-C6 TaxID=3109366 RepID=UPI002DDCC0E4|nr:hypothetical protein [Sedimentibacter sp. MB36-C1]WSI04750.1 hypothetical protein U8307_02905 [Sedimentibacter sp. MB36-C1]
MSELFLKTENGLIPISKEKVEKYNLKLGTFAPFSRFPVVDKDGNFSANYLNKETSSPSADEIPAGEGLEDDEIVEFSETGEILSQSEIIDFSQGTDSSNY